ncbi:MAG: hypothetical protein LBJ46_06295 [Planctomycetota bacterium]|nr:hypothetical protein [Planctomycetota bacterium]
MLAKNAKKHVASKDHNKAIYHMLRLRDRMAVAELREILGVSDMTVPEYKAAIARETIAFIPPVGSVFLDGGKFDKSRFIRFCEWSKVDCFITDERLPGEAPDAIRGEVVEAEAGGFVNRRGRPGRTRGYRSSFRSVRRLRPMNSLERSVE